MASAAKRRKAASAASRSPALSIHPCAAHGRLATAYVNSRRASDYVVAQCCCGDARDHRAAIVADRIGPLDADQFRRAGFQTIDDAS